MSTPFEQRVYELCKRIPAGRVTTYGLIAQALGMKAARAVGNALRKNPYHDVPCHRVIAADGSLGGFSRGIERKKCLLRKEGISINGDRIQNLEQYLTFPARIRKK